MSALHALVSGFSLDSLSAGQVLHFSANPRTNDNFDTEKHLPNPSTPVITTNPSTPVITTIHKPGKPPSPMPVMHIIQWNKPQMPTQYKHFFNQARQPSPISQDQPFD